jgi:septal ring factor EnvC (AmiA/AmiB activator)
MGDIAPQAQENATEATESGGDFATDTLYVEVREEGEPVDPTSWFDLTQAQPSTDE